MRASGETGVGVISSLLIGKRIRDRPIPRLVGIMELERESDMIASALYFKSLILAVQAQGERQISVIDRRAHRDERGQA